MAALNDHKSRAHALLSASSSHRWMHCPMSATAEAAEPDQDSQFAQEGTLAHEIAEAIARDPQAVVDADGVTKEMMECGRAYADYIREHDHGSAEVLLEQRLDFSPWVPEGFGTGDCLILEDGHLTIIDYKYGVGVPVSAVNNDQMRCYALGALNDYGSLYDIEAVTMCIFQPRIDNISEWEQTTEELMAWAENELKPAAKKAFTGTGGYCAGTWCKFCKHAGKCRELTKACTKTVELYGKKRKVEILAPFEIDEILRSFPMIELWMKRVTDAALTKLMNGEEIPGQKLVEGRSTRKWDNEYQVIAELSTDYPESYYMTTPELMSPAALEKSIGKKNVATLVGNHVVRAPGKIGIAPVEDKRPEYKPGGEFENLEEVKA